MIYKYIKNIISCLKKIKIIILNRFNKYINNCIKSSNNDKYLDNSYLDNDIKKHINESIISVFGYKGEVKYNKNSEIIYPSYESIINFKMNEIRKRYKSVDYNLDYKYTKVCSKSDDRITELKINKKKSSIHQNHNVKNIYTLKRNKTF